MIRLVVVDDQALVRQGIVTLIGLLDDMQVVGEAGTGLEAIDAVARLQPDVVVLDIRLPDLSGPDVLRDLCARGAVPPTLLLTTFDDDEALIRGLLAGARGYLRKDVTLEQLATAVRTLASGGSMIHPTASARLSSTHDRSVSPAGQDVLTPREFDVLRLMAAGFSNREVGDALRMSEGTVKNHVSEVLSKLHARDRTRAVLKALEIGWL